jgi:hypothetical protein
MANAPLFFSEQDPISLRYLVIEEIDNSIWAYLSFPNSTKIEKDCFLANRSKLNGSINLEKLSEQGIPPPISEIYATAFSYQPNLKEEDIFVEWINEDVILMVYIKNEPFLYFLTSEKNGFSKSIGKDGLYGFRWAKS